MAPDEFPSPRCAPSRQRLSRQLARVRAPSTVTVTPTLASPLLPAPVRRLVKLSGCGRLRGRLRMAGEAPVDIHALPWALIEYPAALTSRGTVMVSPRWQVFPSEELAEAAAAQLGPTVQTSIVDLRRRAKRKTVDELIGEIRRPPENPYPPEIGNMDPRSSNHYDGYRKHLSPHPWKSAAVDAGVAESVFPCSSKIPPAMMIGTGTLTGTANGG